MTVRQRAILVISIVIAVILVPTYRVNTIASEIIYSKIYSELYTFNKGSDKDLSIQESLDQRLKGKLYGEEVAWQEKQQIAKVIDDNIGKKNVCLYVVDIDYDKGMDTEHKVQEISNVTFKNLESLDYSESRFMNMPKHQYAVLVYNKADGMYFLNIKNGTRWQSTSEMAQQTEWFNATKRDDTIAKTYDNLIKYVDSTVDDTQAKENIERISTVAGEVLRIIAVITIGLLAVIAYSTIVRSQDGDSTDE